MTHSRLLPSVTVVTLYFTPALELSDGATMPAVGILIVAWKFRKMEMGFQNQSKLSASVEMEGDLVWYVGVDTAIL